MSPKLQVAAVVLSAGKGGQSLSASSANWLLGQVERAQRSIPALKPEALLGQSTYKKMRGYFHSKLPSSTCVYSSMIFFRGVCVSFSSLASSKCQHLQDAT